MSASPFQATTVEDAALVTYARHWNNTAGYGPVNATGFTKIEAYHDGIYESSGYAVEHDLVVSAFDYFGQVGRLGESTMAVTISVVDDSTMYGLNSLSFPTEAPAEVRWDPDVTETYVTNVPNFTVQLVATVSATQIPTDQVFDDTDDQDFESEFTVRLRGCDMGEILHEDGHMCVPCEAGEFWWLPGSRYEQWDVLGKCGQCKSGMDCASEGTSLADVHMAEGYYRTRVDSRRVYTCPGEATACPGVGNTSGRALCAPGYTGIS